MVGVKVEHVLILIIVAFVLYKLSRCSCINGFSTGIETSSTIPPNDTCTAKLNELCSASKQEGRDECLVCAGENQNPLQEARCTNSYITEFCSSLPETSKCTKNGRIVAMNKVKSKGGCKAIKEKNICINSYFTTTQPNPKNEYQAAFACHWDGSNCNDTGGKCTDGILNPSTNLTPYCCYMSYI